MSRHQFQVTLLQAYFQVNFNTILTYLPKRIICVDTNARRESREESSGEGRTESEYRVPFPGLNLSGFCL